MELKVLFQDNHLLVVFKPQNIDFFEFTQIVKDYISKKKDNKEVYLEPLYAIDKVIGGVATFCLTSKAFERCKACMQNDDTLFKFIAITLNETKENIGTFFATLENVDTTKMRRVPELNKTAIKVSFAYKRLEQVDKISAYLITSQNIEPNAVRYALADMGAPVFGDSDYNGDALAKNTFVAMFLVDFSIIHPVSKNRMLFRCLPPLENKPWSYFNIEKYIKIS